MLTKTFSRMPTPFLLQKFPKLLLEPKLFLHVPGSQVFSIFLFLKKNYFFKGAHQPDFILEQQRGIIIENKRRDPTYITKS